MPRKLYQNKYVVLIMASVFLVTTVLATGCGSKYGPKTVKVNYYPECYRPIDDLRQAEAKLHKDMATGAAVGAITGLITGLATTGSARGAAVGAGLGLIAGLAGSYLISSAMQEKSLRERFQAYRSSIDAQTANLNIAVRFAKQSCDCYEAAYKKLNASFQRGQIGKEEMLVRLKEIRDGNNDAIKVLQIFHAESVKHTETFAQIYKIEQGRTYDRPTSGNFRELRAKQNDLAKVNKSTESTLALIAKRNSIIENDIRQREMAFRGGNMLASSGEGLPLP
ncbi:MAG: glycine zipper family protein [Deltaproteobacteria bacterium]|jgi:hypothetical protein|nr:glycine zipper family protein [Deltaproteobacteria bacterium]